LAKSDGGGGKQKKKVCFASMPFKNKSLNLHQLYLDIVIFLLGA